MNTYVYEPDRITKKDISDLVDYLLDNYPALPPLELENRGNNTGQWRLWELDDATHNYKHQLTKYLSTREIWYVLKGIQYGMSVA